jgi:hypothetical protein
MEILQVGKSAKYPDGLKYGLILVDTKSGKRVLMDNHHPKGPHVHFDREELPYKFVDEDTLIKDFKAYALAHLGVKL